jgi:serine/threonine protein kinase
VGLKDTLRALVESVINRTHTSAIPTDAVTTTATPATNQAASSSLPIWRRRYTHVRDLGEGGMGQVVLATRNADSTRVCLKFLKTSTDRRTGEQECRALLRLRHPAIVALLDFSLEDHPPWLVSEYLDGVTLHAYIKAHGPLTASTVRRLLTRLLDALDYAHREGVIHRDLKPSNLIVLDAGNTVDIRVLDFGIAIIDEYDHEGHETAMGTDPLGTLLYMAPEQLQGLKLTPACDIYALGLIAWEMVMGRSAFDGKTRSQMMFEKVTRTAGFRLEAGTDLEDLAAFVEASTQPTPARRPTAREALTMLRE